MKGVAAQSFKGKSRSLVMVGQESEKNSVVLQLMFIIRLKS